LTAVEDDGAALQAVLVQGGGKSGKRIRRQWGCLAAADTPGDPGRLPDRHLVRRGGAEQPHRVVQRCGRETGEGHASMVSPC
jgi:hypothetical protein